MEMELPFCVLELRFYDDWKPRLVARFAVEADGERFIVKVLDLNDEHQVFAIFDLRKRPCEGRCQGRGLVPVNLESRLLAAYTDLWAALRKETTP